MKRAMISLWAGILGACIFTFTASARPNGGLLSSGDVVYIEVYRVAELTQSTQVDTKGHVTLPYIGSVLVAGMNESQAAAQISQSLKRILRNPRVTVRKSGINNQPILMGKSANMRLAIIPLKNAGAESMYNTLNGMSSTGGSVSFDPNTNSLLITDTPETIQNMTEAVHLLDSMQSQKTQIRIEAIIAEVQIGAIEEIGIRWFAQGDHLSGGFNPPPARTLGVNSLTGASPFGNEAIAGNNNTGVNSSGREFLDNPFTQRLNIPVQVPLPGQTFLGYVNSGIDLGVMLSMLVSDEKAEIMANPMTLTVNHKRALIKMVDQIPYTEFGTEITGATSFSTKFMDAGITLDVTPHVLQDQKGPYVKLDLNPEISFPIGSNNGVPILSIRRTETTALVRNGQTLAVGGILNETDEDVVTKVPWLGDLPLIGALFRHKEKVNNKTELMIFVTPTIYENPEDITWDKMIDVAGNLMESNLIPVSAMDKRKKKGK